jgi:multidrug efflux pump
MARRFEARMMKEPGVASVTTWVGSGVPRFYLPLDQVFPQANVSQAIVLPKEPGRARGTAPAPAGAAGEEFPEVRGRVKLLPNGPPVPYPVQFRVVGLEARQVRAWADQAKEILRANPSMRGVNDNWNEQIKVLRLDIDQDKARALGVSSQGIAQASRTILSGSTIGQYREGDKLIDIVLRQPLQERSAITDLGNAYLPTASGRSGAADADGQGQLRLGAGVLWREGRDYAVTVQGDVVEGVQGPTVTFAGLARAAGAGRRMPPGYGIEIAGAVEESSKGQGSIAAGVPVMLFIIFTLLMLQLQSFSRAVLVFLTGPLGIAGVAAALLLLTGPSASSRCWA